MAHEMMTRPDMSHSYSLSRLMTEAEVAEYFSVSVKTLRRWRDAKLILSMRPPDDSRIVRFHRRQVQDCLERMAASDNSVAVTRQMTPTLNEPVEDEVAAFQRAYEISQELEPAASRSRGKKGKQS